MRRCLGCGLEYAWTMEMEGEGKGTMPVCETEKPSESNVINELQRKHYTRDVQDPSAGKGGCHQA